MLEKKIKKQIYFTSLYTKFTSIMANKSGEWIADKLNNLIADIESKKIIDKVYIKESLEWFKHERLIHMIVTSFVWLFFVILFVSCEESICKTVLAVILLILEWFYLHHYYLLENWVQKLNQLYLNMIKK